MSHTVTIKTQFKDLEAIKATCKELGLAAPRPELEESAKAKGTGE